MQIHEHCFCFCFCFWFGGECEGLDLFQFGFPALLNVLRDPHRVERGAHQATLREADGVEPPLAFPTVGERPRRQSVFAREEALFLRTLVHLWMRSRDIKVRKEKGCIACSLRTLSQEGTLLLYPVAKITASNSSDRPSANSAPRCVNLLRAFRTCNTLCEESTEPLLFAVGVRSFTNLDVAGLDFSERADVDHRRLAVEQLELEGPDTGTHQADSVGVAEQEASEQEQQEVDGLNRQPPEQPHRQAESGAAEQFARQDMDLNQSKSCSF